jgi:hypothetical protein
MTRHEIIQITANDICEAAKRFDRVDEPCGLFGETITEREVELSIRGHMKRLADLIAMPNAEWERRWIEGGKRKAEIEEDAYRFCARE